MKKVKIYKLQNNGDEHAIAICTLTDSGVVCEGEEVFINNLQKNGIRNYADQSSGAMLFPKDGIKFLENLKNAFRSPYLSATDIIDEV